MLKPSKTGYFSGWISELYTALKARARYKDFIYIFSFFIGLNLLLTLFSQYILIDGFALLEEKEAQRNLKRIINTLNADVADLGSSVVNEAFWDSTYEYIKSRDAEFITADKVVPDALNLNLIMYLDLSGRVIYGETYNAKLKRIEPVSEPLRELIFSTPLLWQHTSPQSFTEGILSTPTGPLLVASRPILNSQEEGPVRGTLIFARNLDEIAIHDLEGRLESSLTIKAVNGQHDRFAITDSSIRIRTLNDQTIEATAFLKDIGGTVALSLSSQMPRALMWQGEKTVERFLMWIYWGSLLLGIMVWVIVLRWRLSEEKNQLNEEKYKKLLEWTEVAIFEEDLSGVYAELEKLRFTGLTNLKEYLLKNTIVTKTILEKAKINNANQMALKTFKVKTKADLLEFLPGNIPYEAIDSAIAILCAIWAGEKHFRCETVNLDCEGNKMSIILSMPIPGSIEEARCVPVSVVDISERKEVELALEEHARTKTTLLQEVNHRVTNNLSAILAMMHLAREKVEKHNCAHFCAESFDEVKARIFNLSIVHSMLSNVQWQPLQLQELCKTIICQTLDGLIPCKYVFQIEGADLAVSSDKAHNLALIMGELAVNSTKYGQVAGRKMVITVVIQEQGGHVIITYADNGPGFAQWDLPEQEIIKGIGHDMMTSIVTGSMEGNVTFNNNNGACTRISFPNNT